MPPRLRLCGIRRVVEALVKRVGKRRRDSQRKQNRRRDRENNSVHFHFFNNRIFSQKKSNPASLRRLRPECLKFVPHSLVVWFQLQCLLVAFGRGGFLAQPDESI